MPTAAPPSSSRVPILLGVVLITVLGVLAWFVARDDAPTHAGPRETSQPAPQTKASTPSKSTVAESTRLASVSGQVRSREPERELGEARVTLLPLPLGGASEGEASEPIDLRCDDAGRWSTTGLAPGRYAVSATATGHLPDTRPELRVEPGAELRGIDFVLAPGGATLTGQVRDRTGGEIEGAHVQLTPVGGLARLRERESVFASTDAAGRYAIQVPEGRFRVRASHVDYTSEQVVLEFGAGDRTQDFELVPSASIEGVVLRADDRSPVAEAQVAWTREVTLLQPGRERAVVLERGGTLTTDAEGRFRIRGVSPGTVLIDARAPGLASEAPVALPISIAEHVEGVEVLVGPAADVRGRVVASDDPTQGVGGAEVALRGPTGPGARALADDEGHFVIHGVVPGGYELVASAEGWLPAQATHVAVPLAADDELVVALARGLAIRGRVEPPTSAEIAIEIAPESIEFGSGTMGMNMTAMTARATSEPDEGRFELAPVVPGTYTLVARAADGRAGTLAVAVGPSGADEVVIRLEPRARIAGVLRDVQGKPVAGATVVARKTRGDRAKVQVIVDGRELTASTAPTSDEGRYELLGLDAGEWTIEVRDAQGDPLAWAEGAREPLALRLLAAEQRELDLVVEARDGRITGTLRDAEGSPVADAWVSVTFVPGRPARPEPGPEGEARSEMTMIMRSDEDLAGASAIPPTLTDAEGRFAFAGLRRGPHVVSAESRGAKATQTEVIPDADLILELAPLGTLEGSVLAAADEDCIARACVVRLAGPISRTGSARAGRFVFERLEPGRYTATIKTTTGGSSVEVEVEAGERASVEIAIQRFARIRGRVLDEADAPVVGALVLVGESPEEGMVEVNQDGSEEPIVTDAEGRFDVAAAPGGRAILILDPELPRPLAVERVVVESGKDVDLGDLHPPPPDAFGPGPGPVVEEGGP